MPDPPIYRALMRAWADRGRTLPGRHDPEWVRLSAPSAMYGYSAFGAGQDPRGEPRFVPVRDARNEGQFNASRDPRNEFGVTPDRRGEFGVGPDPQGGFGAHRGPRGDLSAGAGRDPQGAAR
ncbi:hypothetical protein [Streptomyces sp. NBC_00715]|uniref:hypothetical protein n=1 Tax=Streptomyces sp. NBC_00715 TaxID=2975811 RepID=UPI00386EF7B0